MEDQTTQIALIQQSLLNITEKVEKIDMQLTNQYVLKIEFVLVRNIVFTFCTILLLSVLYGLLNLLHLSL